MSKGISVVELMVSVLIMALLAGAVFVNWRPAEETFSLIRSAHQLAGDIRRVQQLSISTRIFVCEDIDADYSGYGFYLNTTSPGQYLIFENCGRDDRLYVEANDKLLETLYFEEGVQVQSITVGSSVSSASVLFIPPDPKVYINDQVSGVEAVITLELIDDVSQTKEVKINNGGRIEIN